MEGIKRPFHSQKPSIWNFPCSLTRNSTPHSMNNFAFCITQMKDDYTTNSHYLTYTFLFKTAGRKCFLNLGNLGVKGLNRASNIWAQMIVWWLAWSWVGMFSETLLFSGTHLSIVPPSVPWVHLHAIGRDQVPGQSQAPCQELSWERYEVSRPNQQKAVLRWYSSYVTTNICEPRDVPWEQSYVTYHVPNFVAKLY